jgi:hypothetical protein
MQDDFVVAGATRLPIGSLADGEYMQVVWLVRAPSPWVRLCVDEVAGVTS